MAGAIGECVHVAGVTRFLRLAEVAGYRTLFLGPAVDPADFARAVARERPDLVGVSYRLTPEAAGRVLESFARELETRGLKGRRRPRLAFGGTPPVARVAARSRLFDAVFDGSEGDEAVLAWLRGRPLESAPTAYPQTLVERVRAQAPFPLIRHHYGRPSYEETLQGVAAIADSRAVDVISLGVDQNTQEHFFHPEERDPRQEGAGGVPVHTPEQFRALYEASRRGNFPLMRSYSGTRDIVRMAEVLRETIHLAWGAVPLTWYSLLDGRSRRPLEETIREAQAAFAWHGAHGIPLESNEAHHWSLRDAPDSVAVAMAFLAAYNARAAGVRTYVAQFMFNTPAGTSFAMDLAKMLAKAELIESLEGDGFTVLRETRAGLTSMPADVDVARGHLGATTLLQMALRPHIVHVVAPVEADHAATAQDVIEAARLARGVVRDALEGLPAMAVDPNVQARREELVQEAMILLEAIRSLAEPGVTDPWADAATLARAVRVGLIDAPQLRGNPEARGEVVTRLVDGACRAVDPETGQPLSESERVRRLVDRALRQGWAPRPAAGAPAR
ncbi:MAG: methionine synthase [Bacillota bacterium]|nr:methionine synthase [Bacillota bacterium]